MVIKLLQQSTFRRYAAIVLSPVFYFCCFRCVIVPLTGVINYVFCIYCKDDRMDRMSCCRDMAIQNYPKWRPAANLDLM